ncbi:MAG: acyl-CoA dehydrogenase [Deltaproteobacteria bacterium]|nr:acyl-CoA dehydrogenase [Deltaproteobacteria bacterium]MBI2500386.1 acyl-CoA dehydrogenase [Deltaproteobacteria bacterium]
MDFQLTSEQLMIRNLARDFAQKEVAPRAEELDRKSEFPQDAVRKMGELGLMGMMIPQEWGGAGLDSISYVLALEEIAVACASTAVSMSVNNSLYCWPILNFGNEEQKKRLLRPYASGEKIGAYSLSEPGSGSDAGSLKATAKKSGNKYVLNGTKNFVTNGPNADSMILFARTSDDKHKGISAFIVEKQFRGFSVGKIEKKLGICASSTSEIVLENCEVPAANLLGEEGMGFKIAMATLDGGRIGVGTQALGIARAAFEHARDYSKTREAFGQPISEFQAIQHYLADMALKIDASRLLLWRAAWMRDQKLPFSKEAAMAKLHASETAAWVSHKAVQVYGGYGFCKDYPVERYYRDAKITEIYEGTSEIQRLVIARNVLKEA